MFEMLLGIFSEVIGKLTGIKAGVEMLKDFGINSCMIEKQKNTTSTSFFCEDLTKYRFLLSQLDRTDQAILFEQSITQHFNSIKNDGRKKYYRKPLLFIIHGDSHSQTDRFVERVENYIHSQTSHIGIKPYKIPLGKYNHKEEHYIHKFATEILSDGVERTRHKITKELNIQTKLSPIFISIDLSTDDFSSLMQISNDIQGLITFCSEWEKAEFENPVIICIHFSYKYTLFGFKNDAINARIKTTLSSINIENVEILPELTKVCSSEICKEIKQYFSKQDCMNSQVLKKIENAFNCSKPLTMKQATAKFEKLLEEYC
ncbi:hypothetical protein [Candidatus Albibeggiatoa sp. nov. BB20]|uniref:hypothetical protein n=1 Tax=Candidatus Albibeggiatoa sp. nov. BB20 TaxID=3162723 RepID=UPI0033655891